MSENSPKNQLYYGDNLDVLRLHVADESVDLVYLDPPFNSNANYNVLFAERDGTQAAAQIKAFEDTWRWDEGAARAYEDVVEVGGRVSQAMQAFRTFLGESDMLAYLSMMAPRLVELRRVLKTTGSIYLHCDPTASAYLRLLMDAVFGPASFTNEIIWRRYGVHNDFGQGSHHFGRVHDVLLFYAKEPPATWNQVFTPLDPAYVKQTYRMVEPETGRRFATTPLTGPGGAAKGNPVFEWHGHTRAWRYSAENMERLDREGRLYYSRTGYARQKLYLDESKGVAVQDMWSDIPSLSGAHVERLGYPTQKPEALLTRIIVASSHEGDTVLDPFCGCGATVAAAQALGRQWIGIDVTHLAITLIRHRLKDACVDGIEETYRVVGEPVSVPDAEALALADPFQFQCWALGLVGARPVGEVKKGADRGVDGRVYFHDGDGGETKQIVISVKAGKLHAHYVRDLRGVLERERAALGVLLTFNAPTKAMRTEAASAGFYDSPWGGQHPRVQILTVGELLAGKKLDAPPSRQTSLTYKRAPKARKKAETQPGMFGNG